MWVDWIKIGYKDSDLEASGSVKVGCVLYYNL